MSTVLVLSGKQERSKNIGAQRRLTMLILFIVASMALVEVATRILHQHREVSRRTEAGIQDALSIRRRNGVTEVLLVGNSLISEGTDAPSLRQSMGEAFAVHVSGIPGSTFYDWQYGVGSLFERGSQPQVIVFAVSPSQMLRGPATTALPVAQIWTLSDIVHYSRDYRISLTEVSNMMLEHLSTFFYFRDTVRIYVRKFIPGYERLTNDWLTSYPAALTSSADTNMAAAALRIRLMQLQRQCVSRNSRFVFLIVPTRKVEDAQLQPVLASTADQLNIPVIEPVGEREWPLQSYREDGYHLTQEAAITFSHLAGKELVSTLQGH